MGIMAELAEFLRTTEAAASRCAVAADFLGTPYHWSKGDPGTPVDEARNGLDCGGLIGVILGITGAVPRKGSEDRRARDWQTWCKPVGVVRPGDLAFMGTPATHVDLVCFVGNGKLLVIGARGGGSKTFGKDPQAKVKLAWVAPGEYSGFGRPPGET